MGFLDRLLKTLRGGGGGASPSSSSTYWIYARCRRCGEPLKARVNLRNDPSQSDDGTGWVVRKGLVGSGTRRCFQTVEVVLTFDQEKKETVDREISGGEFITEEEYDRLVSAPAPSEA